MSVARAREVTARLRAAGITVHEWAGWENRGNGLTSQYEGFLEHHTGGGFGSAPSLLVYGRPDLAGPLCNTAGNEDGSVTMIAAHPANHAGAGVGPSLGPLPRTNLFNPRVWGHEVVYPGTVPMRDAQYRTSQILARICVDVFGYSDPERARLHAETNGAGGDGKWDAGWAPGRTYDAAAFRRGLATILENDMDSNQANQLQALYDATFKGGTSTPGGRPLANVLGSAEAAAKQATEKAVPIAMTEADHNAIASKVRLGLLDDLRPLFELAERLRD